MKYFVKYVQVNEPVKPGDRYLQHYQIGQIGQIGEARKGEDYSDHQKVELVLCTDDIKVGDYVISRMGYDLISERENEYEFRVVETPSHYTRQTTICGMNDQLANGSILYLRSPFKVLGKIPQRIVKLDILSEGDEFTYWSDSDMYIHQTMPGDNTKIIIYEL